MDHSRRRFLQATAAGTMAGVLGGVPEDPAAAAGGRPNVLILQPDQHRGTVMGCAGDPDVQTPHLDRLASQGVRFTNCVSASPVCSPFRGSFQTGLYPFHHGVVQNNIRMDPGLTTFAEVFEGAGYATGYIGKWHLDGGWPKGGCGGWVPPARRQGWQEWLGYEKSHEYVEVWRYNEDREKIRVAGYDWEPTWQTDVCLDFVRRQTAARRPWLYYLAYGPPHLPNQCPREFLDRYPPDSLTLRPDVQATLPEKREAELRRALQIYYAQVTAVDHEVGRLIAGMERLGVAENTIVLYTSDHGDYLGSHAGAKGKLRGKGKPQQSAFRIPLLVRWPQRIPPGRITDALASSVDLASTVLDLAGLDVPAAMQGISLTSACLGQPGPRREAVYLGLGWNRPIPPEASRSYQPPEDIDTGTVVVARGAFPAGQGFGANATYHETSRNWDSEYDERIEILLPPGRRRILVRQVGKGRMEVDYALVGYVAGTPVYALPTDDTYLWRRPPENRFAVVRDGSVTNGKSLRPHLYGSPARQHSPVFELDAPRACRFVVHVTRSVGDASKRLEILVDAQGAPETTVDARWQPRPPKPRYGGWWRAVWDGRYVLAPRQRDGWLYDHRTDPHELINRVDDPDCAAVRRRLARELIAQARATGDPVLPELQALLRKLEWLG